MTDLECLKGEDSLVVPPGGTAPYHVHVRGGQPGLHVGSITFLSAPGWVPLLLSSPSALHNPAFLFLRAHDVPPAS